MKACNPAFYSSTFPPFFMATKPKNKRKTQRKEEYFTKAEATAISKEVKTFFNSLEKKYGSKFKSSMGIAVTVSNSSEKNPSQASGGYTYIAGSALVLQVTAARLIKGVADNEGSNPLEVGARISLGSMILN